MPSTPLADYFAFLTGGTGDQMSLGALRWFTVALYWALALGGVAVAVYAWRRDPAQRTAHHLGLFLMRFVVADLWFLGTLWKLPLPVSDGFKGWMENTVKYSAFQWHSDIMQVFLNHIAIAQPLVYLLELFMAASLMLGFAVRFTGVIAALFTFNLLIGLYNDPTEWPWTYVGIIFTHLQFAMWPAGRSLGLDHVLRGATFAQMPGRNPLTRAWQIAS
jgi:uncharacterized membrane protein YphA (DoxX/SURF4 family)